MATVKPAAPTTGRGGRTTASGDRVTYANTTLLNVLARAYGVKGYQVEGPSWIKTDRYDILAKAPDNTPKEQIPAMLQALLIERFQLRLRREQKEMSVYMLVTGKGTPKYKRSEGEPGVDISNNHRLLKSHTMTQLADMLTFTVQRLVFDRTNLAGTYDIPLEMSLEELGGAAQPEVTAPSIFTVVEGIGLKLQSNKAPVEVIVVDNGNKVPKEN